MNNCDPHIKEGGGNISISGPTCHDRDIMVEAIAMDERFINLAQSYGKLASNCEI
jgi:hypothetical protein